MRCLYRPSAFFWIGRFIYLLLSLRNSLNSFNNNPLSDLSFSDIFSQSVTYFLIFLTLSFAKFFFFFFKFRWNPAYQLISFRDHAFGVISKKSLPYSRSSRYSPLLSLKRFIVSHFTCRSMIHSEVIFVNSIRSAFIFIFKNRLYF